MSALEQMIGSAVSAFGGDDSGDIRGFLANISNSQNSRNPMDMIDTDDETKVYLDLPGVDKKTLNIDFFNNRLVVKGRREAPYTDTPMRREICYGEFERAIMLPISVTNRENVLVTARNGVLEITVDKRREREHSFSINFRQE